MNHQMASQPPPGYNPEASLLQGGTASILPVQGGGGGMEAGAAPPGYNPAQSLLNTPSTAQIVAVKGGGKQTGGDETKPYEGFFLEKYDPPLEMIEIPGLPDSSVRRNRITKYITASLPSLKEVQSLERAPVTFAFTNEVAPTYQKCATETGKRRLPLNFFEIVRKRIVLIDEPEPYIWIVPNLKGNVSRFIQYMDQIPKTPEGALQEKHYVIFTGSFFSLSSTPDNTLLYDEFLKRKLENMNQMYYINNLNDDFVNAACSIVRSIYAVDTLRSTDGQEKPLSAFFEPDIIIFTKAHIVLKNSELPVQREDNRVKISTLLTLPKFTSKSFLIVPSRELTDELPNDSDDAPPEKKYFTFFFHRNVTKQIKTPATSSLQCPPNQTCSGFKGGYTLSDLGDERKIEELGLYLITKNTDKMPFLKEPGSVLPAVPEPNATEELPKAAIAEPDAATASTSVPKPRVLGSLPKPKPKPKPFVANPSAVKAKLDQSLSIDNNQYRIRIPMEKAVRDDWMKGNFTVDEVNLLNALQLSIDLLEEAFGTSGWQVKLTDFLESLVMSNCYQDTRLMTRIECSNSQQFVRKIYFVLYNRSLSSLYDSLGYVKPSKILDVLETLKRLAALGVGSGPRSSGIGKHEFTGDVFGRFYTIQFDPVKKEYYVDFVVLDDATQKLLDDLKMYREEDTDIDVILNAVLKHKGIPAMTGGGDQEDEEILDLGDPQN
jgi:hypothetical protein